MATVTTKLGPLDHGRPMSFDDYMAGEYREGYRYELIDGRLYVSPLANMPESWLQGWLTRRLWTYATAHPRVINEVVGPGRVFIPGRELTTTPEPDVLAYRDFPLHLPRRELRWQDFSPVLVAEVLSADDPAKDLVRNVALYLLVPSIREYWILDAREDADRPRMLVYRRHGRRWREREVGPGEEYTTPLLPGFRLVLDTRS